MLAAAGVVSFLVAAFVALWIGLTGCCDCLPTASLLVEGICGAWPYNTNNDHHMSQPSQSVTCDNLTAVDMVVLWFTAVQLFSWRCGGYLVWL